MMIAICDDDKIFRTHLKNLIFEYKAERLLHIDVYEFSAGESLLRSNTAFDMVFLDYQMPGIDGMDVARELRRRNFICKIVFVTNYPQFVLKSFEVETYRFYKKPISEDDILELMTSFIKKQKKLSPITVFNDNELKVIRAEDILYLEGNGKYCIIRTVNNTYNSSKTLAQVHALLPQYCFYRSHKSYVVNLYSISSFDDSSVTLTNGEIARIGRTKTAEFKRIYKQFIKDYYLQI